MESFPKISAYMDTTVPTLAPETQIMDAVEFLLSRYNLLRVIPTLSAKP
ncbi:MAG: hypothetical protein WBM45_13580 [Woeseiaceae bacterium]|jgi:hypothetical protein